VPTVHVPSPLRRLTGGQSTLHLPGRDVRTVLAALDESHPGVAERLLDGDGRLHRHVHVFVGDEDVRTLAGLDTPVGADDRIAIVPAIAGGAARAPGR
jgi:sulfur-carrier protein